MKTLIPCLLLTACATMETVDRSTVQVSDNSRIVARNLMPSASGQLSTVSEHLALAQEIYQKQLAALKERRDSLRSRGRVLNAASYATFALTTLGVGVAAIAS